MSDLQIPLLHSEADRARNQRRMRQTGLVLGGIALLMLAGIIAALLWRDATHMHNPNELPSQLLAMGITLLGGGLLIFLWGMKLTPLLKYRKYLREIRAGLNHQVEGTVSHIDEDTTSREGLSFFALLVNVGDPENPEDDRLLYWDGQLAKPGLMPGQRVRILAHGNDIIGLETA
ncbi:MAG: hypothetical protein LBN04_12085 [Oscillospiraceae bacterium]|jgi:hypothetical protein|nr:hypothetical protein [Oscillospiraceae bacterium]